jgi:hypothetical protein
MQIKSNQYRKETECLEEREFRVLAYVSGGHPGKYYGPVENSFPAEAPGVEVESAQWVDDYSELTAAEKSELIDIEQLLTDAQELKDLCNY